MEEQKYRITKSTRIDRLKEELLHRKPCIESARAVLLTESYRQTEGEPLILRRAKAFAHILEYIPITIREDELIVGSNTLHPRSSQTFPEFSFQWLEDEFDTIENRSVDPFELSADDKDKLREVHKYWKGKTVSELALSIMEPEAKRAMDHNIFTVGNYLYNGIGHVTVDYGKVLDIGFTGIINETEKEMEKLNITDSDYVTRVAFLQSVIISCQAAIDYAKRYEKLAKEMAENSNNEKRKDELMKIAQNCAHVPANGAAGFYEACQSFWFVQQLIQLESNGHSISPGRFDQYMYPYFRQDIDRGTITVEYAQELMDCIWVKFNDLSKCRDYASALGFAGYGGFQNLVAGGQNASGEDATNDLSYMCIEACMHVMLPQPSFSIRVWNGSPTKFLKRAAELTKTGCGLPAYYNDEVIIPALLNRGLSLEDARTYNLIGCVEPQKAGKTDGWHDSGFFNMCRVLELVFSNGMDKGEQISIQTGRLEDIHSYEEFYHAYEKQMHYNVEFMINADNAIDIAHKERCPLPFLSCMISDCIKKGKSVQEGGARYNFTGPQGFGIANVTDSLSVIKKLVFEDKKLTLPNLKAVLDSDFGHALSPDKLTDLTKKVVEEVRSQGKQVNNDDLTKIIKAIEQEEASRYYEGKYDELLQWIEDIPKYGNDIPEVDELARQVAYIYTKQIEKYKNPRGGQFQAGLYPVSANVPLGAQTGATPDGRRAYTPIADGCSPAAGRDKNGPTAVTNSVSKLDHHIASNGTLLNLKFHPSVLSGVNGLDNFVSFIRAYFDQKGSHVQFNVVSRETLLDAQKHPENYKGLIVRVAGYSALFTTLSRSLQDDIIHRTEHVNM